MLSLNRRIEVISVEFVNAQTISLGSHSIPPTQVLWPHFCFSGQIREFANDCGVELYFAGLLTRFGARSAVCHNAGNAGQRLRGVFR